jgi:cell division septation protein DedD
VPEPSEFDSGEPVRMLTGPRAPAPSRFFHVVVPGVLMLGVAGVAIWAGTRGGFEKDTPRPVTEVSSSAPSEPAPADTLPSAPAVEDTNAFDPLATPPAAPQAPAETVLAPPHAEPGPPRFCLAVGTYLFSDRARMLSRQLSKRTGLDAWVEPGEAGGARNYKILLGGFATQDSAERTADTLLSRGIVSEAMVEPLPKGRKPH